MVNDFKKSTTKTNTTYITSSLSYQVGELVVICNVLGNYNTTIDRKVSIIKNKNTEEKNAKSITLLNGKFEVYLQYVRYRFRFRFRFQVLFCL